MFHLNNLLVMRQFKWIFSISLSFLFLLPLQAADFTISGKVRLFAGNVPSPFTKVDISDEAGNYTASVFTNFSGAYKTSFDLPDDSTINFTVQIKDICTDKIISKSTTNSANSATVDFVMCDVLGAEEEEEGTEEGTAEVDDILDILDSLGVNGTEDIEDIFDSIDGIEDVDDIIGLLDSLGLDLDGIDEITDILDGIDSGSIDDIDDVVVLLDSLGLDIDDIDGIDEITDILDGINGGSIDDIDDVIALLDSLGLDLDGIDEITDILDGIKGGGIEDIIGLLDSLGFNTDEITDILDAIGGGLVTGEEKVNNLIDSLKTVNLFGLFEEPKVILESAKLYPTLAHQQINIDLEFAKNSEYEIQLLGINGYAIYRQKFVAVRGDNSLSLDLSNMPSGYYIANITTGEEIKVLKFMIR